MKRPNEPNEHYGSLGIDRGEGRAGPVRHRFASESRRDDRVCAVFSNCAPCCNQHGDRQKDRGRQRRSREALYWRRDEKTADGEEPTGHDRQVDRSHRTKLLTHLPHHPRVTRHRFCGGHGTHRGANQHVPCSAVTSHEACAYRRKQYDSRCCRDYPRPPSHRDRAAAESLEGHLRTSRAVSDEGSRRICIATATPAL